MGRNAWTDINDFKKHVFKNLFNLNKLKICFPSVITVLSISSVIIGLLFESSQTYFRQNHSFWDQSL
jgi:hypothetical protein